MAITVLDPSVSAAVAAAADQESQLAALALPWAGGDVTVRVMAGDTLLATLTHAAWALNSGVTPRRLALGTRQARTFSALGTPTRLVFRAAGVDVFQVTAGVGTGDVQFAASITSPAAERIDGITINAASSLPAAAPPPPPPGPGSVLTTLTLSNPTGSAQAADFVTPMFGHSFRAGDVPSGSAPQFRLASDGTLCPATIWGVTSWPDGSMKWCAAMLRVPASVSAGGALTINVQNGGTLPAPGTRATSDLAAAAITVELEGVAALSGTWVSALSQGVTDADDLVLIADGAAGKVWRIGEAFRQASADHGQLYCWHYVAALTNAAGGLLGLRYMGRVINGWADTTSPAADRRTVTATLKSGATTLRSLQGHDASETVGSNITVQHYASFFTCGTDGRWDFVQGGGSASSDSVVRVVFDQAYTRSARMLPPYDLAVSPTPSSAQSYYAMGRGPLTRAMGTTGERPDIGILPSWNARHFLNQSAVDEQATRVVGLVSAGWRTNLRRFSTKQIVPLNTGSYSGLGTAQSSWQYGASSATGFVLPANATTSLWSSEYETSHRPATGFYAYFITGEPQYLDLLAEYASSGLAAGAGGTPNTFASAPVTGAVFASGSSQRNYRVGSTDYYACVTLAGSNFARVAAWNLRDWGHLYSLLPDVAADGSQVKAYAKDVLDTSFDMINAYNASQSTGWRDGGFYYFRNPDQPSESGWTLGYLSCAVAQTCELMGRPSRAVEFRDHLAKFWRGIHDSFDIAMVSSFGFANRTETGLRIESMSDLMADCAQGLMSWDAGTDVFTIGSGGSGNFNWTPQVGDKIGFSTYFSANKPYAVADLKRLYVVEPSGQTFKLSETAGGAPIDVTTTSSVTRMWASVSTMAPRIAFSTTANGSGDGYLANTRGAMSFLQASGNTNVTPARAAQDANWVSASGSFTSEPKYAFAAAF